MPSSCLQREKDYRHSAARRLDLACEEEESCYEESEYDAHGFDNCDLETIVNIVDTNIMPNVTGLLGDTSDEDSDGRVSIVISPVLNAISMTSDDEDDWESLSSGLEEYDDEDEESGEDGAEFLPFDGMGGGIYFD